MNKSVKEIESYISVTNRTMQSLSGEVNTMLNKTKSFDIQLQNNTVELQ